MIKLIDIEEKEWLDRIHDLYVQAHIAQEEARREEDAYRQYILKKNGKLFEVDECEE